MGTCVCGHPRYAHQNPYHTETGRCVAGTCTCMEYREANGHHHDTQVTRLQLENKRLAARVAELEAELADSGYRRFLDKVEAAKQQALEDECGCVLPEQDCPVCRKAARATYAEMPY